MELCYLGVGTNLGCREENLLRSLHGLARVLSRLRCSSVWESDPRDFLQQPRFLNMVVEGWCPLEPEALLAELHRIEEDLGRERDPLLPKGPRSIDIDILVFGRRIISLSDLVIPHPSMRERKFVLLPLAELNPSLTDPVSGIPFSDYLSLLPSQGIYPSGAPMYDVVHP